MKKLLFLFFFLIPYGVFSQASSQVEYGKRICKELSSKEFHGRGYERHGDFLAASFIAHEFEQLKVSPIFDTYFQPFTFPVNTFPTDIQLKINGIALSIGKDYLPDEASGSFSGEWKFKKINTSDWMNEAFLQNLTDSIQNGYYNSVVLEEIPLKGDSLKKFQSVKKLFRTIGNVLLIVNRKINFSVATEQLPYASFTLQKSVLQDLFQDSIIRIFSDIHPNLINHTTQNVLAQIPAKKQTSKTTSLFFTAHYDHLGEIGNQVYFPGASDNASGVGMLLSLARYFKAHPSKYNLVFVAFSGEEAGLIGSRFYVENPVIPLEKIKFLLNLDLMGNGEDGITVVNGSVFKKEFNKLVRINRKKQYVPVIHSRGKAANSDHYFFTEAGVPSFFIYTLGKNKNYHDIYDVYDDLSFAKFQEIVDLIIDFVDRF